MSKEEIDRLIKDNNDMRVFVNWHGAAPCAKCGAYHSRGHICYRCGWDNSSGQCRKE